MSTEVKVSVASDSDVIIKDFQQESVERVIERDSEKGDLLSSPPLIVENNASDSGVSNASSLTSDYTAPLNNGGIHELTKTVCLDHTKGHPSVGVPQKSYSSPLGESSRRFDEMENAEHYSLLEVSETERGLSMVSLEVMTSGEQLNLLADGLGGSEGSVGTCSRSLSPEPEEKEEREREKEKSDAGGTLVTVPIGTETGT